MFPEIVCGTFCDGQFNRLQKQGNVVLLRPGKYKHMYVLRHDHISPDIEIILPTKLLECLYNVPSRSILAEKLPVLVACKCKLVGLSRHIKRLSGLSLWRFFHWRSIPLIHNWQREANFPLSDGAYHDNHTIRTPAPFGLVTDAGGTWRTKSSSPTNSVASSSVCGWHPGLTLTVRVFAVYHGGNWVRPLGL